MKSFVYRTPFVPEFTRTVTSRGQVTIATHLREELGIDAAGKITFVIDDAGRLELRPTKYQVRLVENMLEQALVSED